MKTLGELFALRGVSCSFIGITYTNDGSRTVSGEGERARNLVRVVDYGRLLRDDAAKLLAVLPVIGGEGGSAAAMAAAVSDPMLWALVEMYSSKRSSLAGENPDYTCAGVYESVSAGIKRHIVENVYYLSGCVVPDARRVAEGEGKEYKVVRSSALTLAKRHWERVLKLDAPRYRQYKFGAFERVRVVGEVWEIGGDAGPETVDVVQLLAAGVLDGATVAAG